MFFVWSKNSSNYTIFFFVIFFFLFAHPYNWNLMIKRETERVKKKVKLMRSERREEKKIKKNSYDSVFPNMGIFWSARFQRVYDRATLSSSKSAYWDSTMHGEEMKCLHIYYLLFKYLFMKLYDDFLKYTLTHFLMIHYSWWHRV